MNAGHTEITPEGAFWVENGKSQRFMPIGEEWYLTPTGIVLGPPPPLGQDKTLTALSPEDQMSLQILTALA